MLVLEQGAVRNSSQSSPVYGLSLTSIFFFRVCCSQRHRHTPQNGRFNITAEAHLQVLSDLGVTQIQLDALAEAKGGISRDR